MQRLNVVFFGSGSPLSSRALDRVAQVADICTVVMPIHPPMFARLRNQPMTSAFRAIAKRHAIPIVRFSDDLRLKADVFCVAAFPHILKRDMLMCARLGAVNVHPSVLPRHRGCDPLFWTYFNDDIDAGVTVHWIGNAVDDGDVIAQEKLPLARGTRGIDLYNDLAERGSALLAHSLRDVATGTATRTPQDSVAATYDPSPAELTWSIDYDRWSVERVWHFLRGIEHRVGIAINDRTGHRHAIGQSVRMARSIVGAAPGTIVSSSHGVRIVCGDGIVETTSPSLIMRARNALRMR